MSGRKTCIRCERAIDEWAKICPFCNQDQEQPVPAASEVQQTQAYVPPAERTWRNRIVIAAALVGLLFASFGVGYLINKDDAIEKAPEAVIDGNAPQKVGVRRSAVDLVPSNDPIGETPITSAPAVNSTQPDANQYDRSDATAVSSDEYAQLAARVQAEKQRAKAIVDPRSLTGAAYAQEPRSIPPRRVVAPAAQEGSSISIRTRAVPIEQPLPRINVSQRSVAKLNLVVGEDGSVREVDVVQAVPGETPRIIQAVQRWRFKPATENGRPVQSNFAVEVTFNAND